MPIHINNYALVYSINNGYIYGDTKAPKAIARLMNIAKYYNGDWNPD